MWFRNGFPSSPFSQPSCWLPIIAVSHHPVLVLVLSAIVGTIWSDPTGASTTVFYVASFLLFVGLSGVNIALVHYLMTMLVRLRQQDQQLSMINRELKHRIKNLFSIANSICLQTIKPGRSAEEMSKAVTGRIMAIAAAQDLLTATASEGADLRELVAALVTTLAPEPSRLKVEGPAIHLPADATTPFALVLHELATNALKYGAWSGDAGFVKLSWSTEDGQLDFRWREHDGPLIAPPMREGLGRALISKSLPGAIVTHDLKADGLECKIRLPLAPLSA
ncbi:MAG: sensor histidine kinase [Methyloceanibacter sp.]|nr:sensor histidine kinase [Methyloceanibacter sp.]